MRKVKIISIFVLAALLVTSFASFAAYDIEGYKFEGGVGRVVCKNGTPAVDGNISDGEGYGAPTVINYTNSTPIWAPASRNIVTITARYAWDTTGLYVAADIVDDSMVASTGLDETDIDMEPGDLYGYNGDVLVFAIDPADAYYNAGYTQNGQYSTWYCVSISNTGVFECYRTQSDVGDVTADVKGAASLTDSGWKFEMLLPWDLICDDASSCSMGDVSVKADEITALGTVSRSMMMYMDRATYTGDFTVFSNTELPEGQIFTLSRNMTIPTTLRDGTDGFKNSGESIRSYGIELAAGDASGNAPETTPPETTTAETTTAAPKDTTSSTTKATTTTKASDNDIKSNNTTSSSNTGLIVGIIIAVVVVAAAVVVVIIVMKKKKAGK